MPGYWEGAGDDAAKPRIEVIFPANQNMVGLVVPRSAWRPGQRLLVRHIDGDTVDGESDDAGSIVVDQPIPHETFAQDFYFPTAVVGRGKVQLIRQQQ